MLVFMRFIKVSVHVGVGKTTMKKSTASLCPISSYSDYV